MTNIGVIVTDGQQIASDAYGYVVWFHVLDSDIATVYQVQASRNTMGNMTLSSPVVTPTDEGTLYSYCSNADCPNLAFYQRDRELYVFLKSSAYAFDSDSGVGFWYFRNTLEVAELTDLMDIPEESRLLLTLTVVKKLHELKNVRTPYQLDNRISVEKRKLGLSPSPTYSSVIATTP